MRNITVISMISLDGVLQAPGGPEEDPSGDFKYGGWTAPYGDAAYGRLITKLMEPSDLLLGRKTYEIWVDHWPQHEKEWPGINKVTKYVVSETWTPAHPDIGRWSHSELLKNTTDVAKLKQTEGSDLQVWGSGALIQSLLSKDLVDELWLLLHPLTLGKGKKLFAGGALPAAFTLMESKATTKGVLLAHYKREGAVQTGTVGG